MLETPTPHARPRNGSRLRCLGCRSTGASGEMGAMTSKYQFKGREAQEIPGAPLRAITFDLLKLRLQRQIDGYQQRSRDDLSITANLACPSRRVALVGVTFRSAPVCR